MRPSISIVGAGSWGTALALLAARNGCETLLWGHNPERLQEMAQARENRRYLPGYPFPENLRLTSDLAFAVNSADLLLVTVPSHAFKATLQLLKPLMSRHGQIAWATKGFDAERGLLLSQVANEMLGNEIESAVIAGPTFALEVAAGLPTAITIASASERLLGQLAQMLHNKCFRTYTSNDLIGVQVGGACKNVLAIAAGIADGLGFGANTRSALITRGLSEIMRLGTRLGGQPDTFMGLAGLGDMILTCTDNQSRNRRFGLALGSGKDWAQAVAEIGQEIEGISAAREAYRLSRQLQIDMPITEQVYRVLFDRLDPKLAVNNLLNRDQKPEV